MGRIDGERVGHERVYSQTRQYGTRQKESTARQGCSTQRGGGGGAACEGSPLLRRAQARAVDLDPLILGADGGAARSAAHAAAA